MELSRPPLVVAFELSEKRKAIVADTLAGASAVVYLTELDEAARAEALRNTGALLTFNTSKELRSGEAELLDGARLIQFMIAGVDFIPLGELPDGVPVATNGGADIGGNGRAARVCIERGRVGVFKIDHLAGQSAAAAIRVRWLCVNHSRRADDECEGKGKGKGRKSDELFHDALLGAQQFGPLHELTRAGVLHAWA